MAKEKRMSQLADMTTTAYRRLPRVFGVQQKHGTCISTGRRKQLWESQDGGH
jgi:hypothetical protein